MVTRIFSLLLIFGATHAFVTRSSARQNSGLAMAPKFKNGEWVPTKPEEGPEAGYPPIRTLLLHGPKPYFQRIFSPNDYEQAVLKFMAGDKCSRDVAQGNMDAYLRNPNDWAYNRLESERKGFEIDYVTLDTKSLVLTVVWAFIITTVLGRVAFSLVSKSDFWAFGPFS